MRGGQVGDGGDDPLRLGDVLVPFDDAGQRLAGQQQELRTAFATLARRYAAAAGISA
nr:hypothetical protein [Jiangella alkaliphila]